MIDGSGSSDVPGPAWARASGLGWASQGSGLPRREPGPELRARPGLGLVGLEPGLDFQNLLNGSVPLI